MDDFFHYSDFLPFLFRTHTIISSSDLYTTFSFNHPQSLCSLSTSCQQFIFSKEFRSSQVSSCQGPAIYKQVLPLAGAKASITTQLPTVPSQRAISFSTKSQPGKHLRVLTRSKVKKPCATMVPGTKEATELGKIDGGWRYLVWGQNSSCMDVCMLWEQRHKVIFGYLPVYCYPAMAWPI